ncbi:MAG: pilus assembly protein PilP [Pseudomonadales bacterium]|nr:pilus assembly protein PilP [Pseudomonadales bacterium]
MISLIYRFRVASIAVLALSALVGCSSENGMKDLNNFVEKVKEKPSGTIDPLPQFLSYEAFSYKAARLRDPFSPPVDVVIQKKKGPIDYSISPDTNRPKEYLENFNLATLKMVGSIERDASVWALINDGQGGIYTVTDGNYLGLNHGRVTETTEGHLYLLEIVPDGQGGWLERPQRLAVEE